MTIKAILVSLPHEDMELLSYSLETGLTNQFVEYRPGRFIGVNILPDLMPTLIIDQTAGMFSAGTIVANCNESE